MKLKAAAMYYALAVSLIIAVLLSTLILIAYIFKINSLNIDIKTALINNSLSGIEYLKSSSTPNGTVQVDLYSQETDSVKLVKKQWGLFEVLASKAFKGEQSFSKVGFFGREDSGNNDIALYLSNETKSLSVSGQTIIKGEAYLPKGGVKRVSIEGKNYVGTSLVYGEILEAANALPKLADNIKIPAFSYLKSDAIVLNYDEIVSRGIPLEQSFLDSTVLIYTSTNLSISDITLKGNIIVYSNAQVIINGNADLEDVLVVARSVIVKDNFEGQIHVMAKDSICLEKGVRLAYPSSLLLENDKPGKVVLEEGVKVFGGLIVAGNIDAKRHSFLIMKEESEVFGNVYVDGKTSISGSIIGSLYTKGFYLKTTSGIYENYLLDAEIDISKKPKYFIDINLFDEKGKKNVIKWLK